VLYSLQEIIYVSGRSSLIKLGAVIHQGLSFAQKWRILMMDREKAHVEGMIEHVLHYMRNFEPLHSYPSDVGYI
jgi:hypothetical protein